MEDYKKKYEQALDNFKKIKAANKDNKELVDFIEYMYPELKENKDEEKPNGGIVSEDFNEGEGFYKVNLAYLNKEQVIEIEELVKKWNPELRDSEDEKIRKALKEAVCYYWNDDTQAKLDCLAWLEKQGKPQVRKGNEWVNTIDNACTNRYVEEYAHGEYCDEQSFRWGFQEGVDWLEKQGEQKTNDKVEPKFKVGDTIRRKGSSAEYTIESIYGGCYHGKGWGLFIDGDEDYELVEQKPTWSEEDENGLGDALWAVKRARTIAKDENEMGGLWYAEKWLKSLKERIGE